MRINIIAVKSNGKVVYKIDESCNLYHYPNKFESLDEAKDELNGLIKVYATPPPVCEIVYTSEDVQLYTQYDR